MQTLIRRRVLWRLIWVCTVANVPVQVLQITLFTRHSDVKVTRIAPTINRYLDFVQKRCLISLVNDNHVDNIIKVGVCILWLNCKQSTKTVYYTRGTYCSSPESAYHNYSRRHFVSATPILLSASTVWKQGRKLCFFIDHYYYLSICLAFFFQHFYYRNSIVIESNLIGGQLRYAIRVIRS